jgi:hypothetical protein
MLLLLETFMHQTITAIDEAEKYTEREAHHFDAIRPKLTELKPCDYFDLIGGTGTGGLIAIMLGRLRMGIEDCKSVYQEMTRFVFETDKTIAGIPYRSTLFKASKLEDAIRNCVQEYDNRSTNDHTTEFVEMPKSPRRAGSMHSYNSGLQRSSTSSTYNRRRSSFLPARAGTGDPNAELEDSRPDATKT